MDVADRTDAVPAEEKAMSTEGIGVLVGVDESACSQQALAWAAADAAAKGLPLTVAGVVDLPHHPDIPISGELIGSAEAAVRRRVETVAARATRELSCAIPVLTRMLAGDPAAELLRLAAGADEVVMGSHGTGRFGRLLIGSVSGRVAEGPAARELVNSSRSARLLVVGTRGHGGLAGMLLGSVSHAVLRHAFCPVAIAR